MTLRPKQLGLVWDLRLDTDPEGPALIFHAAVRHDFGSERPAFVPLRHNTHETLVLAAPSLPYGADLDGFLSATAEVAVRCAHTQFVEREARVERLAMVLEVAGIARVRARAATPVGEPVVRSNPRHRLGPRRRAETSLWRAARR